MSFREPLRSALAGRLCPFWVGPTSVAFALLQFVQNSVAREHSVTLHSCRIYRVFNPDCEADSFFICYFLLCFSSFFAVMFYSNWQPQVEFYIKVFEHFGRVFVFQFPNFFPIFRLSAAASRNKNRKAKKEKKKLYQSLVSHFVFLPTCGCRKAKNGKKNYICRVWS